MTDLDENKRVVRSYCEEAFNGGDPEGAVKRYVGTGTFSTIRRRPTGPKPLSDTSSGSAKSSPNYTST